MRAADGVDAAGGARAAVAASDALGGGRPAGFARALEPRPFVFPRPRPHPEYRTEWWYYTGNLATAEGRRFGFQLTFFRIALAPSDGAGRGVGLAASQVYIGAFRVTDAAGRHFPRRALSREALGLAGAKARPFRVWLEDWSARAGADGFPSPARGGGRGRDRPHARARQAHGAARRARAQPKGPEAGNASYYYSLTRMPARGTVRVGAENRGDRESWMDREWSTSALGRGRSAGTGSRCSSTTGAS